MVAQAFFQNTERSKVLDRQQFADLVEYHENAIFTNVSDLDKPKTASQIMLERKESNQSSSEPEQRGPISSLLFYLNQPSTELPEFVISEVLKLLISEKPDLTSDQTS